MSEPTPQEVKQPWSMAQVIDAVPALIELYRAALASKELVTKPATDDSDDAMLAFVAQFNATRLRFNNAIEACKKALPT